ncbi:Methyl-CpG-binding domain-containing protein 7 [Raphanus sativus]|uniref:Methyl-CpG-binding domain-containing protein 7-like n=1 Tax=Raphanus sativus TaxID=3726 RepID=A0A6J0L5Q8_RAPSA|nr:methyl-CpG-binding domain-containing protein 7-like [Raphanus sativus]KAJ4875117.1 Methyl-CpG-binding domain-containing protein 7 [Raphanus sativus]
MKTRSSSSAALVPFVKSPVVHGREALLQIVDPTSSCRKLLPGWTIVKRSRSSSTSRKGSVDTYFVEPGTGREFPSLESVQRHLVGEVHDRRLTRTGHSFSERTRVYEKSITTQDHRRIEYASKGFRLPKGWTVEEFPRLNSYQIDKCYIERKTGNRFRSLVSVERYLKDPGKLADKQPMRIEYGRSRDFSLPNGWIVEGKPRSNSSQIDKTYIEPGTGNKFRSLAAVERYLNGANDSVNSMVPSGRLSAVVIDEKPPEKVNWVLNGPGGNMFSAHVSGSVVPSSVNVDLSLKLT